MREWNDEMCEDCARRRSEDDRLSAENKRQPGVHLTVGEARLLLAVLTEAFATKGSITASIYCFEQCVEIDNKLRLAVLGEPK